MTTLMSKELLFSSNEDNNDQLNFGLETPKFIFEVFLLRLVERLYDSYLESMYLYMDVE